MIPLSSAFYSAIFAALSSYVLYLVQRKEKREGLLYAVFGELGNILEHYAYAADELPSDPSRQRELRKRLRWSIYGKVHSADSLRDYGFLDASDIRLLLQLNLRIRNTDTLLESFLEDLDEVQVDDLASVKLRMSYTIETAKELLERLVESRPKLGPVLKKLEQCLPSFDE